MEPLSYHQARTAPDTDSEDGSRDPVRGQNGQCPQALAMLWGILCRHVQSVQSGQCRRHALQTGETTRISGTCGIIP